MMYANESWQFIEWFFLYVSNKSVRICVNILGDDVILMSPINLQARICLNMLEDEVT